MEIAPVRNYLTGNAVQHSPDKFSIENVMIDVLICGIGIIPTAYHLMEYLSKNQPTGMLQAGIGGAVNSSFEPGQVVVIESEFLFDEGVQQNDGSITSPFQMGWMDENAMPFREGFLNCPHIPYDIGLPVATGMTTIHSHGYQPVIDSIPDRQWGQIENMEGAAFFYVNLMKHIPFLSIRSVSNKVESRDTANWQIENAINALNDQLIRLLHQSTLFT